MKTVREIRRLSADMRIQVDTNASLLTPPYLEELVEAGMTDISPDLKAWHPETFMKLCGIASAEEARRFLDTSWNAVHYLREALREKVFTAVSLPYHPRIHTREELACIAGELAKIDRDMAVTVIAYQPAFRLRDWPFLTPEEMEEARRTAQAAGLQRVALQGGEEMPLAVDPLEACHRVGRILKTPRADAPGAPLTMCVAPGESRHHPQHFLNFLPAAARAKVIAAHFLFRLFFLPGAAGHR